MQSNSAYSQYIFLDTPRRVGAVTASPNYFPGDTVYEGPIAREQFFQNFNPATSVDISETIDFTYNCFGYAFTGGSAYISEIEASQYFDEEIGGDGSYSQVDYFSSYVLNLSGGYIMHISVPAPQCPRDPYPYSANNVISKWRFSNLVWHPYDADHPWAGYTPTFHGPANDIPYNHSNLSAALAGAKTGQVVKIYSACPALDADYNLSHDLKLMSGGSLDINGHSIIGNPNYKIILNGGSISSSTYCLVNNPSYGVVGIYPTLALALAAWGSGETISVYGSHSLSSLTIPAGNTIQICSGGNITVSGSLTVYGSLSVTGANIALSGSLTVQGSLAVTGTTLNFSGGGALILSSSGSINCSYSTLTGSGWSGISVYSSSNQFTGCNINNASTAINVYNSSVYVSGCRITGNTNGINFAYGNGSVGGTVFDGHYDAVVGDAYSYPSLSYNNSFRTASRFDVLSSAGSTVYAVNNYWQSKEVTNNVNTTGELGYDPNPKRTVTEPVIEIEMPLFKKSAIAKVSEKNESGELFDKARLLLYDKNYDSAFVCFKTITEKYSDSLVSRNSLMFMEYILDKKEKNAEVLSMLNSYAGGKGALAEFANYRKNYYFLRNGKYEEALTIIKNASFTSNEGEMEKVRLLDLGIINHDCLDNKQEGLKYFNELVSKYPDDRLSKMACTFYGIKKGEKEEDKKVVNNETIKETTLFANYPNPFNPSTTIKYNIAENTNVSLKVYDVMGREVKTLVNDFKAKGAYEVKFDARGLASGMYFYQLKAGNTNKIQKMILTK